MPMFKGHPVDVEARQYTRDGYEAEQVAEWCKGRQTDDGLLVDTTEGEQLARYGDWVIKEPDAFAVCGPDEFRRLYEAV